MMLPDFFYMAGKCDIEKVCSVTTTLEVPPPCCVGVPTDYPLSFKGK